MAISITTQNDINKITDSLYKHSAVSIDKFIQNRRIKVACHQGCDTCCKSLRVEVLPSEAFYIADKIKQTFSEAEIEDYIQKLQKNNERAKGKNIIDYGKERIECAFLKDNQCSIYDFRPYKCRAFLATDASFCQKDRCFTEQVPELNNDPDTNKIVIKYITTLSNNNLEFQPAELNNALFKVLTEDLILTRFLNQEKNLFDKLILVEGIDYELPSFQH